MTRKVIRAIIQTCKRGKTIFFSRLHLFVHTLRKFMTLDLQVATRNKVNAKANYVSTYLQSLLSNYFEKKVVKFTPYKTWTTSVKKEIDDLQQQLQNNKFRIVFRFGHGNVSAEVDTTFSVE